MFAQTVSASPLSGNAKTKRIPAGTKFALQMTNPVSTTNPDGTEFTAIMMNDQTADSDVILPMGSVVRGTVRRIEPSKRFSKGAVLYLDFDHVVTPNGRQIPLDLAVCQFDKIYYDGSLYKNLGYGEAVQQNYERAVEITKNSTNYGLKAGESAPGIQYLTAPICAVGGFFGGACYWIGDGVMDMFRKGQDVYINKGDVLTVKLVNPIDVPVY